MIRVIATQQLYLDHLKEIEFRKRVLHIMINLIENKSLGSYLHNMLSELYVRNKSHKLHNVCLVSGRTRAVTRRFGVSRIMFRRYGQAGFFPGVTKAS